MFTPTMDAFQAALFLEDTEPDIKPFGYITIPSLHVQKENPVVIDQELEIIDHEQFARYTTLVMQSETYRLAVRGQTDLHLGALPTSKVNFNKVMTSQGNPLAFSIFQEVAYGSAGLNKLRGFRVAGFNITLTAMPGQPNMFGTAFIPNPSPQTLTVGNVTQDLFVGGTPIGNTTIENLVLRPGDNYVPITSITDQAAVIGLLTTRFQTGILPVDIRGRTVVYNGQRLPYFERAFATTPLSTSMDIGAALEKIGLDVSALTGGGGGQPAS